MKKDSKRNTKQKKTRIRSMIHASHVLIAVVAIIECLILISFTTFSWIETSSSLVIETGKKYLTDQNPTRIPIAQALNYKFTIDSASGNDTALADLNTYFSLQGKSDDQDLYRYARTSTANGKDYFFKRQSPATNYRKGDTADINAGYTYFDFTLSNTGSQSSHKYKFYFAANTELFTVTAGEGSTLTDTQLLTIKNAMRISFQTGTGTPKIYSPVAQTYDAVSSEAGAVSSITTTAIDAGNANQRLFTIGKNTEQKISVRIWLEEKASGLADLVSSDPQILAGADIAVNLKLTYAQNDYDFLYFDDYTFSSGLRGARNTGTGANLKGNIGGHLTEDDPESDDYRMYFVYRTSNSATGYVYPMTIDEGSETTDAIRWVTCDKDGNASATVPDITGKLFITNLTTASHAALTFSYFAYGKCALSTQSNNNTSNNVTLSSATTAIYTWKLNSAGSADASLTYNAYSATAIKSNSHTNSNQQLTTSGGYGCGGWAYNTALSMVYFRDLATGISSNAYNEGGNFKYITNAVGTSTDTDGTTDTHRSNVMYVNQASTVATSMTEDLARATATMYFDKGLDGGKGLFKSWVPSTWLTSGNRYFHYCSGTYYNNNSASYSVINWTAPLATKPSNSNDYIYTALGYNHNNDANTTYTVAYYSSRTAAATGVGCWNAIESEPVYFSTELIDNSVTSAFRYQIGVKIDGSNTASYYSLIPDETKTKFYAYIPVPGTNASPTADYADGAILFSSYDSYSDASTTATQNATWWGRVRSGSRTYYPVAFNTTAATSAAPKGWWNLGVIVDGTYEHFFWVPAVTQNGVTTPAHILGEFYYNTTGHTGTPSYTAITLNQIDEYRWYVPLDGTAIGAAIPESVYFKWVPYAGSDGTFGTSDDTVFTYSLYISDGIYCVITEAEDNTPTNAFD